MTPRELLWQWLSDEQIEDFLAEAKANGLFIGPVVATPEMRSAGDQAQTETIGPGEGIQVAMDSRVPWSAMVEVWQRGEGA